MTQKGVFKIDVYNCVIHVTVSDNDVSLLQSINHFLRKDGGDTLKNCPCAYAYGPKDDVYNYYLFFTKDGLSVNYLNHEKSHVIDFILEDRDIPPVDEARSHLDGFISHKLNLFFSKRKIKIKNKR